MKPPLKFSSRPFPGGTAGGVLQASDAFENIVKAWSDYKSTAAIEETKREGIRAWRDVQVALIEKNTEILKGYLFHSFSERRIVIDRFFVELDRGIKSGNVEMVSMAMGSIVSIVKQSPLAGARQMIDDLNNPDIKEIEI